MLRFTTSRAVALLAGGLLLGADAPAQDATRGAMLYRTLPGNPGVGSCISCHGDPVNNRNSVLRGAVGGALISRTISAVGAMGYLRQHLVEADLADIAAYLATVVPGGALDELPAPWPTGDDFGSHVIGTTAPERTIVLRNLQPLRSVVIAGVRSSDALGFPVQHDCPLALPPLAQCQIRAWFRPQAAGPASAVFEVLDSQGRVQRTGNLSGSGVALAAPALGWAEPAERLIDFGRVAIGSSAQRSLRLRNTDALPVALTRLRVTGPNAARFTLTGACIDAARIEARGDCELQLRHSPTAADRSEGWIEIVADAAHPPLMRVQAFGEAAVAPPPAPPAPPPSPPAADPGTGSGGGALSAAWVALLGLATALLLRGRRGALSCRPGRRRSS